MALVLKHQTPEALLRRFRERFATSDRERCVSLGEALLDRITAGDITDAQVRTAFGMTAGAYNTLKTRITQRRNARITIASAVGE